jgi:hypothetical protein
MMTAGNDPRPIGVFDSGLGGLTSVREIFRLLPGESVAYFGDTARLPYGSKSGETVTRFALEIANFLVRQNVKCLLVACKRDAAEVTGKTGGSGSAGSGAIADAGAPDAGGVLIELLHNAFLVHDDIVAAARTRGDRTAAAGRR